MSNLRCSTTASFARHVGGSVAVIFGFAAPVILSMVALGTDAAGFYNQQSRMQAAADSTSLAAAKELQVYGASEASVADAARSRAATLLKNAGVSFSPDQIDVSVDKDAGSVGVTLRIPGEVLIPVNLWGENPIVVRAEAQIYGNMRLCVLALAAAGPDGIAGGLSANVSAPECALQSNSTDQSGISMRGGAKVTARAVCSSGGVQGAPSAFQPDPPQTDCPPLPDPLADRLPPAVGACDYKKTVIRSGTKTISPGTYCGGISVMGGQVTALPGIYIIKGGPLIVSKSSVLRGEDVSFYFVDGPSIFQFNDSASVDLSAPRDGPMAGILLYVDSGASSAERRFHIRSGSVDRLLGTIYLPNGVLDINGKGDVAEDSAYTVIIANRLNVQGAKLVVNADYESTDVPLPPGLNVSAEQVRLQN